MIGYLSLLQSFSRQSFLSYSNSALDLYFMPHCWEWFPLVAGGIWRFEKKKSQHWNARFTLCSGDVAAALADTVQGRVTRFKWYRNIFKGCFNDCWQKVMQSVNGRSCSWMGNNTSAFLVAMALLHWLVSVWEGQSLVLHCHTLHPSSNFPVNLECVMVRGCEVVFKTPFQAMF